MQEYQLDLIAMPEGEFGVDVRPAGATGSTPFVRFESWKSVRGFFEQAGLGSDLMEQIEGIAPGLTPGTAYHEIIFLPDEIPERLQASQSA